MDPPAAAGIFLVSALLCQTAIAGAVDPPGLSLKDMDSDERALYQGITGEQFCPCGMDRGLADSLQVPKVPR